MTDTETERPTMEQCARKTRDDLTLTIERARRLRALDERGEKAAEELEESLESYGASIDISIDVTLYGGGPAGGVTFDCDYDNGRLTFTQARVWHQDWFQQKGWAPLDDDATEYLWYHWGLDAYGDSLGQ